MQIEKRRSGILYGVRNSKSIAMRIMLCIMLMSRCRAIQIHKKRSACEQAPGRPFLCICATLVGTRKFVFDTKTFLLYNQD